jgi:hypothetical protein
MKVFNKENLFVVRCDMKTNQVVIDKELKVKIAFGI